MSSSQVITEIDALRVRLQRLTEVVRELSDVLRERTRRARFGRGRPTKRTPRVEDRLLRAIRNGSTMAMAARRVGVTRQTVANWASADPDFSRALGEARQAGRTIR